MVCHGADGGYNRRIRWNGARLRCHDIAGSFSAGFKAMKLLGNDLGTQLLLNAEGKLQVGPRQQVSARDNPDHMPPLIDYWHSLHTLLHQ
jgi:hypothetical protein